MKNKLTILLTLLLVLALVFALSSCGKPDDSDTATNSQTETDKTTESDVDSETNTDTAIETESNTEVDTETTNTDAESDTTTDSQTETETVVDSETEGGTETGSDIGVESDTNTETESGTDVESDTNIDAKDENVSTGLYIRPRWEDDYREAWVEGIGECKDTDIVIPSDFYTIPVTGILDRAFEDCKLEYCASITSITIPSTITYIDRFSFNDCTSLKYNEYDNGLYLGNEENPYYALIKAKDDTITSCVINENTKVIATGAFSDCYSLKSAIIGGNVTNIGESSFDSSIGICHIEFNEFDNALYLGTEENPYYALIKAKEKTITSCKINENTVVIGDCAFEGCDLLESVEIANKVKYIGESAFEDCSSLKSVEIPDSVIKIEYRAFCCCFSLTSIIIGNGVEYIGRAAFIECDELSSVSIGNNVVSVGNSLDDFDEFAYTEYENALYVGNEENPYYALVRAKDETITSCIINEKTKIICAEAFADCALLADVEIPNGVKTISSYAFFRCDSLEKITIPDSVTNIEYCAIYFCENLKSVDLGPYAGEVLARVCMCMAVEEILLDENNTRYKSIDGNLYSKDGTALIQYAVGKAETTFEIPQGVTTIGAAAFFGCASLEKITIPNSVTSIGDSAFYSCDSLTIYCEATEQPSDWSSSWNSYRPVYWYSETEPTTEGNYWRYVDGVVAIWE